ncbi:MAG TPA: hypothetical protein VFY84_04850 [Jiangellales bacterium]|nr:hypothetical protein [Jiangellales bacterium]
MTYPANNLPVLRCWRCHRPADVEWCDVSTYARQGEVMLGRMICSTPGCVDENGTAATSETPPPPQEIQRKADAATARFWQRALS